MWFLGSEAAEARCGGCFGVFSLRLAGLNGTFRENGLDKWFMFGFFDNKSGLWYFQAVLFLVSDKYIDTKLIF